MSRIRRCIAVAVLALTAACAVRPSPEYRLGLYATNPDPFGDVIGAEDDLGLEDDFDDFAR